MAIENVTEKEYRRVIESIGIESHSAFDDIRSTTMLVASGLKRMKLEDAAVHDRHLANNIATLLAKVQYFAEATHDNIDATYEYAEPDTRLDEVIREMDQCSHYGFGEILNRLDLCIDALATLPMQNIQVFDRALRSIRETASTAINNISHCAATVDAAYLHVQHEEGLAV